MTVYMKLAQDLPNYNYSVAKLINDKAFVNLCTHSILHLDSSQAMLPMSAGEADRNAAFSLLLPGKVLHLNAPSHLRKFRDRGNKPGAVKGFEVLQDNELGHC